MRKADDKNILLLATLAFDNYKTMHSLKTDEEIVQKIRKSGSERPLHAETKNRAEISSKPSEISEIGDEVEVKEILIEDGEEFEVVSEVKTRKRDTKAKEKRSEKADVKAEVKAQEKKEKIINKKKVTQ